MEKSNFNRLRATKDFVRSQYSRLEGELSMQACNAYLIFTDFLDLTEETGKICIPDDVFRSHVERYLVATPADECPKRRAFLQVSKALRQNVEFVSDKICLSVNLEHRDMPECDLFMVIQNHGNGKSSLIVAEVMTSPLREEMNKNDLEKFLDHFLMNLSGVFISDREFEFMKLDNIGMLPKRLSDLEKQDELYRTTGYGAALSTIALEAIANTSNAHGLAESVGMRLPAVA